MDITTDRSNKNTKPSYNSSFEPAGALADGEGPLKIFRNTLSSLKILGNWAPMNQAVPIYIVSRGHASRKKRTIRPEMKKRHSRTTPNMTSVSPGSMPCCSNCARVLASVSCAGFCRGYSVSMNCSI